MTGRGSEVLRPGGLKCQGTATSTQPLSGGSTSIGDGGATVHPLRATPARTLDAGDTTAVDRA